MTLLIISITISIYFIFRDKDTITIGITNSEKLDAYEEYFKTNNIINKRINFVPIGTKNNNIDPFLDTQNSLIEGLSNGTYDMILEIEEDYILPILDSNLLYDTNTDESISNFIKKHTGGSIKYVPSSIDSVRVLILNKDMFDILGMEIPYNQLALESFLDLVTEVQQRIIEKQLHGYYAISFGSPIDEYLFDDIAKYLQPLKDSADNKDLYLNYFIKLSQLAKQASFKRDDVGHNFPLDFSFSSGKIAIKIATSYEIELFTNKELSMQVPYEPYLEKFEFIILPLPYINDEFNYTSAHANIMCISVKSNKVKDCMKIVQFFLSKEHAINVLNGQVPFSNNIVSIPIYVDDSIYDIFISRYGFSNFYYGSNLPTNYFIKNYEKHWMDIQSIKALMDDYVANEISQELFKDKLSDIFLSYWQEHTINTTHQ